MRREDPESMSIQVKCESCGAIGEVGDEHAGGLWQCECGHDNPVPEAPATTREAGPGGADARFSAARTESIVRFRSRLETPSIAPMITMADVAFLLIIFFLLTSTFAKDTGLDITLPKALSSEQLPKREITVWVNAAGQLKVNEEWIAPRDLTAVLTRELAETSLKAVTIRGDEHVPYGTIVTVMDIAKRLGAGITLAAEVEMAGPPQVAPAQSR